ncbi:MAG: beta-ketoacyl-ACP synthase II, partial [Chitinophagaceae bacterium]|nr:beta-ketoacyl-ACP synthase II [Chitinophagaceae bacterium]
GLITFQHEVVDFAKGDGTPRFNPFFIPKMILDIAAGQISMRHNLRGPNFAVVSACASSTNALMDAFNLIRLNKADIIVSGGSEAVISEAGVGGFNAMKAMSERNSDPKTASRPYDKDRDGFVMGEAAGVLILEELEHAKARGARIYCEIVGCGATADAHHITAPHPDGLGARNVMIAALDDAEMKPEEIDYINTHGTSTPMGDGAELKAITAVFGEHAYKLNISSTKSMTGHCLGAAGAIEAIASIMAVVHDIVPPTINHFTDDPELDGKLNFTFNTAQKRTVNAALSNTFGFGGHNACIIVKKFRG